MTRNEMVAKVMGWEHREEDRYTAKIKHGELHFCLHEVGIEFEVTKLLQQRMVDDGWHVHIYFVKGQAVQAEAFRAKPRGKELSQNQKDEPAAIFDLFCKVYGIATQPVGE